MNEILSPKKTRVFALLPAAGTGERTGLKTPKQFCEIAGYPLILHTLWNFQRSWITEIVVAVSEDWLPYLQDLVNLHRLQNVRLVIGGQTRHKSIRICVQCIQESIKTSGYDPSDVIVIVHDAVRPFVAEATLQRVSQAASMQGAAGVVCPLVSTTLATRPDGTLDYSLVRANHCNSHTPQAFAYQTIVTAYEKISQHDLDHGTEVLHLALEYAGVRAKLLETEDEVWKVTYRRDICAAEQFARERLARVAVLSDQTSIDVVGALTESIQKRRLTILSKCSSYSTIPSDANAIIIIKNSPPIAQCISDVTSTLETFKQQLHPCKGSLVLLITMPIDDRSNREGVMTRFRELQAEERCRQICVYCVVLEIKVLPVEPVRVQKACDLASSLILRQDEILSGQTFII